MDTTPSPHCLRREEIRAARSRAELPVEWGIKILDEAHRCMDCRKACCCRPGKNETWEPSPQPLIQCLRALAGSWGEPFDVLLEQVYSQERFSASSEPTAAFAHFDDLLAMSKGLEPGDPAFVALQAKRFAYLAECLFPFQPDPAREHISKALELLEQGTEDPHLWALIQRISITITYHDKPEIADRKFAGMLAEVEGHRIDEYELRLDFTRYLFEAEAPPDLIRKHIDWLGATSAGEIEDAESLYLMSLVGDPLEQRPPEKWGQYSNQVRPMRIRFAPQEQRRAFAKEWAWAKDNCVSEEEDVFLRLDHEFIEAAQLRWLLGEEAPEEDPTGSEEAS